MSGLIYSKGMKLSAKHVPSPPVRSNNCGDEPLYWNFDPAYTSLSPYVVELDEWNMLYMFVTLEVSKEDRSREDRDEQPSNMLSMRVTLEVSKEDRSREARDEQPSNICHISVTLDVSKEDRSREARDEQPSNMPPLE